MSSYHDHVPAIPLQPEDQAADMDSGLGTNTLNPFPTPAPEAPGRRPARLRSSCDACGIAKVRCDKAQPRCRRCADAGLACVYGLSRKFGKAPRRPSAPLLTQTQPYNRTSVQGAMSAFEQILRPLGPSPSRSEHTSSLTHGNLPGWLDVAVDMGAPARTSADDHRLTLDLTTTDDVDNIFDPGSHLGAGINLTMSMPSAGLDWFFSEPGTGGTSEETHIASSALTPSTSVRAPEQRSTNVTNYKIHADGQPNCHQEAYDVLASLSFRQVTRTVAASDTEPLLENARPPEPTLDQVLLRNDEAMSRLEPLLDCTCSRSPHLAMICASILSKVLIWYQQAAGCKKSRSWSSTSISSSSLTHSSTATATPRPTTPTLSQATGTNIAPTHMTIGAFPVGDESVQDALRRQLILGELKKLAIAIERFSGRGSRGGDGVDELYASLEKWLKDELNLTTGVLKGLLLR